MSRGVRLAAGLALLALTAALTAEEKKPTDGPVVTTPKRPQHWAYRPVTAPVVPVVKHEAWVRMPIDAFILSALEGKELAPSADADRGTFIRRATLDVWGVTPTPEEVQAFLTDRSPKAYDALVDRLLASPKYGERQARRWLDLARYADSTGFEGDRTRPNMWRYRDYVIDAFNKDLPYDRFIREQLAGDEVQPRTEASLIATGFLLGYPDNFNSRDMVQRKYQITTDMVDTVGSVFLGQTLGCARCHNHKFDTISQKEYFQFQAFFANTAEDNHVPVTIGPREQAYRDALKKWQETTKAVRDQRRAILDPIKDEVIKYQKERYLVDTQASLFKPRDQWTPLDRWVNHRWQNVTEGSDYEIDRYLRETALRTLEETGKPDEVKPVLRERYKRLGEELSRVGGPRPEGSDAISTVTELGGPAVPTYVLFVGNHERPLEEVQPGFPAAIAGEEQPVITASATASGRRTALANWIASPRNPLTARVFVNRVWAQYFGRGLVESVSNFGRAGRAPSHPELLDYLASNFVTRGWSVKALHREILLSSVYRQSSLPREDAASVDPQNTLLALFPRQRLEAEQIRDSLLRASGRLVDTVGGPSVFAPVPKGMDAGNLWRTSKNIEDHNRRSLYIFTRRSAPYPLLDVFNGASSQQAHSQRTVTTTPLQALTLYNDQQVFEWSQALAGRVAREAGPDPAARINRLYDILFARKPDAAERDVLLAFLGKHGGVIRDKAKDGILTVALPVGGPAAGDLLQEAAFVDLVHVAANSNDFIYRY